MTPHAPATYGVVLQRCSKGPGGREESSCRRAQHLPPAQIAAVASDEPEEAAQEWIDSDKASQGVTASRWMILDDGFTAKAAWNIEIDEVRLDELAHDGWLHLRVVVTETDDGYQARGRSKSRSPRGSMSRAMPHR